MKKKSSLSPQLDAKIQRIKLMISENNCKKAIKSSEELLAIQPRAKSVWNLLGIAYYLDGDLQAAIKSFNCVATDSAVGDIANYNLAQIYLAQGDTVSAEKYYRSALRLNPNHLQGLKNLAHVYINRGECEKAIPLLTKALHNDPQSIDLLCGIGDSYRQLMDYQNALAMYDRAVALAPDKIDILRSLALIYHRLNRYEEASHLYEKCLTITPNASDVENNLGMCLLELGFVEKAICQFERAATASPNNARIFNNWGIALRRLGQIDLAIEKLSIALSIEPDYADALNNMGIMLKSSGEENAAISYFEKALKRDPSNDVVKAQLIEMLLSHCNWSRLNSHNLAYENVGISAPTLPLTMLYAEDHPERQLQRAKEAAKKEFGFLASNQFKPSRRIGRRLQIGYFSADFHNFPGMHLMVGMLEGHDRNKVEIHAFSYGPRKQDSMRTRVINAVDHFHDVSFMDDKSIVNMARSVSLDIAINRNGYTFGARNKIFGMRLAPLQISFLGYPGSLGSPCIDYLVADKTVIPDEFRSAICEKVIFLPHTYQPNDNTRVRVPKTTTRAEHNLPEDAFVFCCFNQTQKIGEQEFAIWMSILNRVPNSVLWIMCSSEVAKEIICSNAIRLGVNPERLIFANKIAHEDHMERHWHADLFLDTFNYNAHTTASDAILMGLPIVTKEGRQFSARVCSSLLKAVNLPELITRSDSEYFDKVVELSTDQTKLLEIKSKLRFTNVMQSPLYDTQSYVKNFEKALFNCHLRWLGNEPNSDIEVNAWEVNHGS